MNTLVRGRLASKATLYRNWVPVTAMENTWVAVHRLCSNSETIVVTVDADDALIGDDVVDLVKRTYAEGRGRDGGNDAPYGQGRGLPRPV